MDTQLLIQGLKVTALGLAGVFAVLILFYGVTRLMLALSSRRKK